MAQGRPYQAYQNTQIGTSNQKQLVIMLFDGMNRFMNKAIVAVEEHNFETAHENLQRTSKILMELLSTLREDKGGEIAINLKRIYVFCYEQIVIANLRKDAELIREVRGVLSNLREAWRAVSKAGGQPIKDQLTPKSISITG